MSTQTPVPQSREEWAAFTADARRRARLKAGLARARKIVTGEPKLTDDQLTEVAQVFLDARTGAAA